MPAPTPRKPPYRLLLFTQDFELCGAQRQLVELAGGLDRARYDVRVCSLVEGGPLAADVSRLGSHIVRFPRRWRWDMTPVLRLASYLRRERIDIVHAFLFLPNFYSRLAGRLAGTPAIISSLRGEGIEGKGRYVLDVRTCFMCHVLIANSDAGRAHYVGQGGPPDKIQVIRNGINQSRFLPANDLGPHPEPLDFSRFDVVIGMVAAMEERKDHDLLLQAFQALAQARPQLRVGLVLIGDGARRDDLEQQVRTLDLTSRVLFTGRVRCPEHVYPRFDLYAHASKTTEGVSNSILEAMSCALPVVATDVGGNREVVVDGQTGAITPAGDVASFTQALCNLLDHPERRQKMGQAGQDRVHTVFSLEAMVQSTQQVYERLLTAQRRGRLPDPATP